MFEELIKLSKNKDLTTDQRYKAILALVQLYKENCFDVLTEILQDSDENPEIRSAVALGLGKLGEESLIELKKHMQDESPIVRNYVVQAIGMIGEKALPHLFKALKDNNNDVFYSAADAIGSLGTAAVPHLTQLLESGADDAKCVAAWKLGEIKDTRSIPALIKAVKNEDNNNDILALSTWALGEVSRQSTNNKSVLSALYRASRNTDPEVKRHAFIALRKAREYLN